MIYQTEEIATLRDELEQLAARSWRLDHRFRRMSPANPQYDDVRIQLDALDASYERRLREIDRLEADAALADRAADLRAVANRLSLSER